MSGQESSASVYTPELLKLYTKCQEMTEVPGLQSSFYGWNQKKFVNQTDLVYKEMIQFSVIGVCQYEDEMKAETYHS